MPSLLSQMTSTVFSIFEKRSNGTVKEKLSVMIRDINEEKIALTRYVEDAISEIDTCRNILVDKVLDIVRRSLVEKNFDNYESTPIELRLNLPKMSNGRLVTRDMSTAIVSAIFSSVYEEMKQNAIKVVFDSNNSMSISSRDELHFTVNSDVKITDISKLRNTVASQKSIFDSNGIAYDQHD